MPHHPPDSSPIWSRRMGVLIAVVIILAGVCWWTWSRNRSPARQTPAVCAECGHESQVTVGSTPSLENWPRQCPNCGKASLYLGVRCRQCRKLIPMKGPSAEKIGDSYKCPWCKSEHRGH